MIRLALVGVGRFGIQAVSKIMAPGKRKELLFMDHEGKASLRIDAVTLDTDKEALEGGISPHKIHIEPSPTGHWLSPKSANAGLTRLKALVKDSDLVFLLFSLEVGPLRAFARRAALAVKESGAHTIGIVRAEAESDLKPQMVAGLDAFICLTLEDAACGLPGRYPQERLERRLLSDAHAAIHFIAKSLAEPGLIGWDFADLRAVFSGSRRIWFGWGRGLGRDRVRQAVDRALDSPHMCRGPLHAVSHAQLNILADGDLSIDEVDEAAKMVLELMDEDGEYYMTATPGSLTNDRFAVGLFVGG